MKHLTVALISLLVGATSAAAETSLFATSDRCMACHNGLAGPSGEDLSIGFAWRSSIMANAARDPYWQAAVRRELMDHPGAGDLTQDECSACHMPMTRFSAKTAGDRGKIFAYLPAGRAEGPLALEAVDGVSCSLCHQIQGDKLGTSDSFDAGFVIDTKRPWGQRLTFGQWDIDAGSVRVMQSSSGFVPSRGNHIEQSELCASCHTLYTSALGPGDKVVGRLPEQVPFLEWQQSAYRSEKSCQACHMTVVQEPVTASSVLGKPRTGFARHGFQGANFFMLRLLNRYRADLGVAAMPQEMDSSVRRTSELLQSQAATVGISRAELAEGKLEVQVTVTSTTGHKLPTAYPARRAWLAFSVRGPKGDVVFASGTLRPDGSIDGNDNDRDRKRFEPHYTVIENPGQVQIYESIMLDPRGAVTTGLLSGVRYGKDNRLLPRGFDKRSSPPDTAVQGEAAGDGDFVGGSDGVLYRVRLPRSAAGPFRVDVELWYQPIGYRWANNLAGYDAPEPTRFLSYYRSMASSSAIRLAAASTTVK